MSINAVSYKPNNTSSVSTVEESINSNVIDESLNEPISIKDKIKQKVKNNKGTAFAITASCIAAIAIGTMLVSKKSKIVYTAEQEKQFQTLIENGDIDLKTLNLFKDIFGAKHNISEVYDKVVEFVGLKIKPEFKIDKDMCGACFNPREATVYLGNKGLGTIFHELIHAKQNILMYRKFGKQGLAEAFADTSILSRKRVNYKMPEYNNKTISELTKEELAEFKETKINEYLANFNEEFYEKSIQDLPELTKEESELADKYFRNAKAYDGHNGILENEAYSCEIKFEEEMKKFLNIIKTS